MMKSGIRTALALTLTVAGSHALHAFSPVAAVSGSRCPEGHPETGDIGITSLLCVSGSCGVNLQSGHGYTHEFSTEPRIDGVRGGSPADGRLRDGDVITAIDGVLITTREGGRRLANLKPGVPITLHIRRGGREMEIVLVPKLGCNMPRLAVLGDKPAVPWPAANPRSAERAWPARAAREAGHLVGPAAPPPFNFGLELECGSCGWRSDPWGTVQWFSSIPPTVRAVQPGGPGDLAGLQPGDVLLQIDGHALSDVEDGRALGKLLPGEPVELRFRRGREVRTVSITPEAAASTQRF